MSKKFVPEWVKNINTYGGVNEHKREVYDASLDSISIAEMAFQSYEMAKEKGWWDEDRDVPHCLALIHSEVSEALEAYRESGARETYHRLTDNKPEGLVYELADVLIRIGDLSEHLGLNLDLAVQEKMQFNSTRGHRHGNKLA